ncbi:TIM barrel protein [Paenibacillus sp. sptzw28]|uniref:sugar phosphate isomerase/epimerase family protein n=1 Tax=Paenibacillus sp. sptzw28 TaxID=715179 RepID=UPI00286896A7|nr:TIM barrel protein [Paenibacillus sp. sptzw28]
MKLCSRFLIGQYGRFDYGKFERDFRSGFYGIEASQFSNQADYEALAKESARHGFQVGIHYRFRHQPSKLRDALFLARDQEIREQEFIEVDEELQLLSGLKPNYVLFHYPKPVILDERADWNQWHFADRSEYEFESVYDFESFQRHSEAMFEWLSNKGEQYAFTPLLEFDALNRYVYDTDLLEKLLEAYPRIKLCLDTGRLHLQERIDPHFNAIEVILKYAGYAALVHLANSRIRESGVDRHVPVLPEQRPQDGWAPIEQYLRIILKANPDVKILFEHRSDLISDEQLDRCYAWVENICEGY